MYGFASFLSTPGALDTTPPFFSFPFSQAFFFSEGQDGWEFDFRVSFPSFIKLEFVLCYYYYLDDL